MAMQQLTLPGDIVKKHNELVRSKVNISNIDSNRILANLIACLRHDDVNFQDTYSVAPKDFISDQGGGSYARIKAICRELAKATAEKEWFDPDSKTGETFFEAMPFFISVTYHKGIIKAEFNPKMSGMLLNLRKFFTEINLIEFLSLPSFYSQRIFEILKSWSGLPEVILPMIELHNMLSTPNSMRFDFRQFRIYVLEKAHKDILENTSLEFEWEPIKTGRSVDSIRFIFGKKKKAILEEKKVKDKAEKTRIKNNKNFSKAFECCENKKGICKTQDNQKAVCKICTDLNFKNEQIRLGSKEQQTII